MTNLIRRVLEEKQVELSPIALDLSERLREQGITRSYIIVMTGRCGSTWLATALSKVAGYGKPLEFYSEEGLPYYWSYDKPQTFSDVFLGIARKYSDQGKFGFKINPQRLFWLNHLVNLPKTFAPDTTAWIDMRRWNLVKQALSFVVAKKTGLWHRFKSTSQADSVLDEITISDQDIWREILNIVEAEQQIDEFYAQNSIVPLRIWYEEIFDSKSALLLRVLTFIDPKGAQQFRECDGDTERLNQGATMDVELAFIEKYGIVLNDIYARRNSIDVSAFSDYAVGSRVS